VTKLFNQTPLHCGNAEHNIHIEGEQKTPCCLIYDTKYMVNDTVDDAYKSDQFQDIRASLQRGQQHPACVTCWRTEKHSDRSPRTAYTQRMKEQGIVGTAGNNPRSMTWAFSNTCNFACRTCFLQYSTGWMRETRLLAEQGDQQMQSDLERFEKQPWDQIRLDEVLPHLPHLEHLELFGGETLISTKLPQLLETIVSSGHAGHIDLVLTTNGSQPPKPWMIKLFAQFRSVQLTFSIDAVTEDTFRYVRTGDWQQVQESIDQWFKQEVRRRCTITFSTLNVWDCDRIMSWCDRRFALGNVNYNWVEQPAMYNAVNMPEDMKHHIMKHSTYWHSRQVLPNMFTQTHNPKLWQEFLKRTEWLDQSRSQSLEKFMPQLFDIINRWS
jgi:hypothetical protein